MELEGFFLKVRREPIVLYHKTGSYLGRYRLDRPAPLDVVAGGLQLMYWNR
jgi:hypothetical protein